MLVIIIGAKLERTDPGQVNENVDKCRN